MIPTGDKPTLRVSREFFLGRLPHIAAPIDGAGTARGRCGVMLGRMPNRQAVIQPSPARGNAP